MGICPFMSNPKNSMDMDALYPCINSCALYTGSECSLKLMAKSQYEIAKNSTKNDKS